MYQYVCMFDTDDDADGLKWKQHASCMAISARSDMSSKTE